MAAKKPAFGGMKIKPDAVLGKVIGTAKLTPPQMTKKLWDYFKSKKLTIKTATGPFGGMKIKPDANLKAVIGGATVPPTQVFKLVWAYITKHGLKGK